MRIFFSEKGKEPRAPEARVAGQEGPGKEGQGQ